MTITTVSSKYQIVIPRELRQRLGIVVGQRLHLTERDGIIQLVPEVPLEALRGSLRGKDVSFEREAGRRL